MALPSLGIAVPTLNAGRFIEPALRSLVDYDGPFEAIIRDGGSTDGTVDRIRDVVDGDPRFRLEVGRDGGQAAAINAAWAELTGRHPFVTWLNGDDLAHPVGLAAALRHATSSQASIVYGDFLIIDEDGRVLELVRRPRRVTRTQLIYNECLVPGVLPVIRTAALRKSGLMAEDLRYALDYELFIRLTAVAPAVRTAHIVASFRAHDASKTSGTTAALSEEEANEVRQRHQRLPPALAQALRRGLRAKIRAQRMLGRWAMVERYGKEERPSVDG